MDALTEGRADLALGYVWDLPDAISSEQLYEDTFLVAGRPDALPQAPAIDLAAYCAADHVLISPGGDLRGVVDSQLEAMGRSRRVILGLPAFLPALAAVAATRALVTLPSQVARAFAPGFGLVTAEPPIPVRRFPVSAFWHRRNENDPRTFWIRKQIQSA
jgi:DNA-binding transcriptional LysR family regulator